MFKSREERERAEALKASKRVAEALGLCMYEVIGGDVLAAFWFQLGTLLRHANHDGWVHVEKDLDIAAASLLAGAGLLTRREGLPSYLDITSKGRDTVTRLFHLK